jgi:hypothetical protein
VFVSIDPGRNVGVASFTDDGKDIHCATINLKDFKVYLKGLIEVSKNADEKIHFLYEDFTLRKDKALDQTGSEMPAPKCIGMVELAQCVIGDAKSTIEKALPGNLITAFKWDGRPDIALKMERNRKYHPDDKLAAHAHGTMWLINMKIKKHPIFES